MFFIALIVPLLWFMEKANEPPCERGLILDRSVIECAALGVPRGGK
jgi:hypothetical protein